MEGIYECEATGRRTGVRATGQEQEHLNNLYHYLTPARRRTACSVKLMAARSEPLDGEMLEQIYGN